MPYWVWWGTRIARMTRIFFCLAEPDYLKRLGPLLWRSQFTLASERQIIPSNQLWDRCLSLVPLYLQLHLPGIRRPCHHLFPGVEGLCGLPQAGHLTWRRLRHARRHCRADGIRLLQGDAGELGLQSHEDASWLDGKGEWTVWCEVSKPISKCVTQYSSDFFAHILVVEACLCRKIHVYLKANKNR